MTPRRSHLPVPAAAEPASRWPFPFPPGTPPFRGEAFFRTTEALEAAAAPWGLEFLQLSPWPRPARSDQLFTGRILAVITDYSGGYLVRGEVPSGARIISVPLIPEGPAHDHGRPILTGRLKVERRGRDFSFNTVGPTRMLALTIAEPLYEEALAARFGADERRRTARTFELRSPRDAEALEGRVRQAMSSAWGAAAAGPTRREAERLDRRLLDAVLECVEPFQPLQPDAGRLVVARQLEQLLRDHQRRALSIAGLCRELGAPVRTAEQGFHEAFGLSPRAYLTLLRLNTARAGLRAAPPGRSVSQVAAAAGFTHLGRFSVAYRRLFGESPRVTRSRATAGATVRRRPSTPTRPPDRRPARR